MSDLLGFLFIVVLGTFSHFIFEWSGHKRIFSLLCAVNESTWEHMKLAFGPAFIWLFTEIPFVAVHTNFWPAKMVSVLVPGLMIPLFFYTYKAILGHHTLPLDILDFVLSVGLGQFCSHALQQHSPLPVWTTSVSILLLLAIFTAYMTLTLYPPQIFLFVDPVTGLTGLQAHVQADRMKKENERRPFHEVDRTCR